VWLDQVQAARGLDEAPIEITWKPFSLQQANQKIGPDYKAWDEGDADLDASLWGLRAGVAAKRQGEDAMRRYMPFLLRARHEERKDLGDQELLKSLAKEAGLDVAQFEKDLNDRTTLDDIAASHGEAVEERGVFGTPTFVFENGASAFLKLIRPKTPEEAEKAFDSVVNVMQSQAFVGELKRPQPPWPKGVFD
jgi:protein-disulfide isomerase-like protein with CxxC motif